MPAKLTPPATWRIGLAPARDSSDTVAFVYRPGEAEHAYGVAKPSPDEAVHAARYWIGGQPGAPAATAGVPLLPRAEVNDPPAPPPPEAPAKKARKR